MTNLILLALAATPDMSVLAPLLRELLLKHLPTPLVSQNQNWGGQREVVAGYKFQRNGFLQWQSEPQFALRNDGHWSKVTVTAREPAKSLALGVENVTSPADGKTTFDLKLAVDVDFFFEQQLWKNGLRLYSGSTRARCRPAVLLNCEATSRFERKPNAIVPEFVLRVRVTDAKVFYSDLVVEHTLGVGGDAAKTLGEVAHKLLTKFKPQLEKDVLARADAAIVKAADTKEVRIGFEQLFTSK